MDQERRPGGVESRRTAAGQLDEAIDAACQSLLQDQHADGYWAYDLEADCTIPAEYVLMMHFMDEVDVELEQKIGAYLRPRQIEQGGWPLYYGGDFDISCSVKAYYALKLIGDSPAATHMKLACEAILANGGAARSNSFTRITLALFEQIPWRGVPFVPVELILLPRWFPFHISKISYWARTVMVPLSILCSFKPRARNPRGITITELFTVPPDQERHYFPIRSHLNRAILVLERIASRLERFIPDRLRQRATRKAIEWTTERLNGIDGLGAIFPAMVNAYEALDLLGYEYDHPYCEQARTALQNLLVIGDSSAWCQPCVSPVWDTAYAIIALQESGDRANDDATGHALDWLADRQLLETKGDWLDKCPDLPNGSWPFQFRNDYYPDLDDTAVVAWLMLRSRSSDRFSSAIQRAATWLCGMQSGNGGFAAFDIDNDCYYLNEIPFADHGAMLDPPTSDVSARCLMLLSALGIDSYRDKTGRILNFLRDEQEADGSWYGRWGTNYIYGTWSVLMALAETDADLQQPYIRKAVTWLKSMQQPDGGWGEDNDTYLDPARNLRPTSSTPFQTAWALLGLMAAGETGSTGVRRGIDYLLQTRQADGLWHCPNFTAPGFPKVFYLKYHGYDKYFPTWALARYRRLAGSGGQAA
ncbi:MAG: squalene--hopene cyclase [Pseudomonadota bacterium]